MIRNDATVDNLTVKNLKFTTATGTNLFYTNASGQSLNTTNLNFVNATGTNLFYTLLYGKKLSGTRLNFIEGNGNTLTLKDSLSVPDVSFVDSIGDSISVKQIEGIGAQFNIAAARKKISDNTSSSINSVLGYVFAQGNPLSPLRTLTTTAPPNAAEVIVATNTTGDAYLASLNAIRGSDTWTSLGQEYKNLVINLGTALVRNLVDLGQCQQGGSTLDAYLQTAAGLSVLTRYAAENPTGPLYPFTQFVNGIQTGFDLISERNYTGAKAAIDSAYNTFATIGFPTVVSRLAVPPSANFQSGGLGTSGSDQLAYIQGLFTRATATTQSTLNALLDLAKQGYPTGPIGPTNA